MSSSLNLIFIVILFYCQPSSCYDDPLAPEDESPGSEEELSKPEHDPGVAAHVQFEKCTALDHKMMILLALCGTTVAAMLVLTLLVIFLHIKVSKATKTGKGTLSSEDDNSDPLIQGKVTPYVTLDPCKVYEECRIYRDFDSLPPCFCDSNEGL